MLTRRATGLSSLIFENCFLISISGACDKLRCISVLLSERQTISGQGCNSSQAHVQRDHNLSGPTGDRRSKILAEEDI